MASATQVVVNKAGANQTFSLVGQTATGALYKDATRSLAEPRTMEFQFNLGNPGSLGNDKISVIIKDSHANATTGKVVTLVCRMDISIPRDSAITTAMVEDIICHWQSLAVDANSEYLADAMVP